MSRLGLSPLLLGALLGAMACEGREIAVFDVPAAGAAGSAGAGAAGTAGSGGSTSDVTGGTAGNVTAPAAGTDSGGSVAILPQAGSGGAGTDPGGAGGGPMGSGGTPPMPCTSDADCMGWRCEKKGCDATSGFCEPPPIFCPPDPMPVCGCDGVTYWNDCLRRQSGAQVAAPEECRANVCTCEVGSDCKVAGASCSHLVAPGEMCGHSKGACWVLPPECVPAADPHMWQECKPADPNVNPCIDTCNAIRAEKPYVPHRSMACN